MVEFTESPLSPALFLERAAWVFADRVAALRVHTEGSIEAGKLAMFRAYNPERAGNLAMKLAGLDHKK